MDGDLAVGAELGGDAGGYLTQQLQLAVFRGSYPLFALIFMERHRFTLASYHDLSEKSTAIQKNFLVFKNFV
nr:hypothetical protein [uncultured Oscillibacter sp.]